MTLAAKIALGLGCFLLGCLVTTAAGLGISSAGSYQWRSRCAYGVLWVALGLTGIYVLAAAWSALEP